PGGQAGYDRPMLSFVRRARRVAFGSGGRAVLCGVLASGVALALTSLPSCTEERLPPPRSGTSGAAAGAGGAAAGAGGAAAGAGGTPTDAGVDEEPGPANLCECVAAYGGKEGRCGDCFNEHASRGGRCQEQLTACDGEPGCRQISLCLKGCGRNRA